MHTGICMYLLSGLTLYIKQPFSVGFPGEDSFPHFLVTWSSLCRANVLLPLSHWDESVTAAAPLVFQTAFGVLPVVLLCKE